MKTSLFLALSMLTASCGAQARPAITGIAYVRITTAEPSASQTFYSKLLGLSSVSIGSGVSSYAINPTQHLLVEALPIAPDSGRVSEIAFTTHNAAALQAYLLHHHVSITTALAHGRFEVVDPEGHLLAFVQQHNLPTPTQPNATSHRLIHAGFIVRDRAREDAFYRDILGFHLFWEGGQQNGITDWVNMQVPDGSDCVEYMLRQAEHPPIKQLGVMNHIAFGTASMTTVEQRLQKNGCTPETCGQPQMGKEGKIGLNLYDPDLTRVEFIEFQPTGPNLGSPFTGIHPQEQENQ